MKLSLYTDNIDHYLKNDKVINYENEAIVRLADSLWSNADSDVEYIKMAYEFAPILIYQPNWGIFYNASYGNREK